MIRFPFLPPLVLIAGLTIFAADVSAQGQDEQPQTAQAPARVLPAGEQPQDGRLDDLKTLNGHFPFEVPESVEAWEQRSEQLRRRVLVATGLWPMPERTPLEPVIHGNVKREGFTVERVYFQSLPGHFVTGLLFRPAEATDTPRPAVLSPHGHGGRMQEYSDEALAKQIEMGAEKFENSGRFPKLARCAQLARMGCVTFIFDMLGYADSVQVSYQVSHRHKDPRPEEGESGPWCFYSPQADLRLQSIMGLQTWNSVRALDFLASLPDVDSERLAVTGGSGGGTQSILLGAIDQRPKVSFPNGMVSTSMQGGCYCENCSLLRVDTGNVELAALFAPRPQAMTAADDWTRDMMDDGFPELRRLYAMLGVEDFVACYPMLHFPHNYNYVTRAHMYDWMNRHLELGLAEPIVEEDYQPLSEEEAAVWNEEHPAPSETGVEHERAVLTWLDEQANAWLADLEPSSHEELAEYHDTVGAAWRVLFDQPLPDADAVASKTLRVSNQEDVAIAHQLLSDQRRGAQIPLLLVKNGRATADRGAANSGPVVIWTTRQGKSSAFTPEGQLVPEVLQLLEAGADVMIPDLFGQGELHVEGTTEEQQRLVDDDREYSAFTFGYNRTLVAERVADLLSVVATAGIGDRRVALVGSEKTAAWALPTAVIAGPQLTRAAVDTAGFRFADVDHYSHPDFVPGSVKYGDLPALMALRAPYPLRVAGEQGRVPEVAAGAYGSVNAGDELSSVRGNLFSEDNIEWLLR